ncbi:MAG: tryptophan synthase subunit beta [Euryarchaeota archaeon]|nr:tryptophan synthase subunit beta [Euryarchaeota archaeon]MDE1837101.1 tryptophan synthase subunit beta [Euryarchaeota archaeon]MDE2045213.1 tryptophan synthase subunit beta [Thermoplasmata archaeon]
MPEWYGPFGGTFVPETLVPALQELESAWRSARKDPAFKREFQRLAREWGGRPTPLYFAENLTREVGGAQIYLKREDLVHGGAHKFNNALGQGLLAKRLGKTRLIAETGAGQHGVATAMVGAKLALRTEVYMGAVDMERQKPNVQRMRLLGATVRPVDHGGKTLKEAINEAFRDWITNVQSTYYLLGSAVGPHPFPSIVCEFQSVIGREILQQARSAWKALPDLVVACVGGGSNAIGTFHPLLKTPAKLLGVEAAGSGAPQAVGSASLTKGRPGVLQGMRTYLLQDAEGQILETDSIAAGLDYAGVGPEHAYLKETGRVEYTSATDTQALEAFHRLARTEGILPALEPSHALAEAIRRAATMPKEARIVVTLSGRGDKDLEVVGQHASPG